MLSTDGMVSPGDRVLDVAQYSVDPIERRVRHAGTSTTGDMALMYVGAEMPSCSATSSTLWL